jgi:biopolymer transport protein ExbB/TolQ
MSPELWAILLTGIGSLITAIVLAVRRSLPKYFETLVQKQHDLYKSEIEAAAYERNRHAFWEDNSLELLNKTVEWLQEEADKDREESRQERELQRTLIATTDQLARAIGRNNDILRILAQNAAKIDDRLAHLETLIRHNSTNWLGRDDSNG